MRIVFFAVLAIAPLSAQTIVVQNATILTVSKGTIKGSILVRDGSLGAHNIDLTAEILARSAKELSEIKAAAGLEKGK